MKNFKMKCFSKQKFKSCGDLTIYPIREIRGSNRILYGDKYDNADYSVNSQNLDQLIYSSQVYSKPVEPVYAEIKSCKPLNAFVFQNKSFNNADFYLQHSNDCGIYEKLYHCYSQPSLNSDSCDSGYRSSYLECQNKVIRLIRVHQRGIEGKIKSST